MADSVDEFIGEIQTELCRLMNCASVQFGRGKTENNTFGGGPCVGYGIGVHATGEHHTREFVGWVEFGGKTEFPDEGSDENNVAFVDVCHVRVSVHGGTKESCRKLWQNLRIAAKNVAGDQVVINAYTSPSEDKQSQISTAYFIQADVDLRVTIPASPARLPGFPEPKSEWVYREVLKATDQTLQDLE
jgi:hypothetical protein